MVVTRREFMTGTGAVLATSRTVKGFPFIVQPAALKVGVFISERDAQGVDELLVPYVSQMRIGLELAASEINAMGGIRGRGIELVYRDDGGLDAGHPGDPVRCRSEQDYIRHQQRRARGDVSGAGQRGVGVVRPQPW